VIAARRISSEEPAVAKTWKEVTREEWFACAFPGSMMIWLRTASGRKLRLFACASCRQVWNEMSEGGRELVLAAEQWADGMITRTQLQAIRDHWEGLLPRDRFGGPSRPDRAALATATPRKTALRDLLADVAVGKVGQRDREGIKRVHSHHVLLLHDIFDSLFLPAVVEPPWRSPAVLALAKGIYASATLDGLPILADALEEAGCNQEDILSHFRSGKEHTRGCWALDLVLGMK
jgi:hypothetical protein